MFKLCIFLVRCAVLGVKHVQRCCWAWARPWRPRWRPWSRSCYRSRPTPTSSSGTNNHVLQKSNPGCKYFATLCRFLFWANLSQLYALDWADLKSRSDANTALDVLAENLSVFKVGRALLASNWPQKGYDKWPKVKLRKEIKNFWGNKCIKSKTANK